MIPNADIYTDFAGLTKLRADVRSDANSQKNLREVASQFEALFTKLILKNMREAKLSEGLFDSNQEDQYLDLFDSQLALHLSRGAGLGLSDMLVRQLSQGMGTATQDGGDAGRITERSREGRAMDGPGQSPQAFAQSLWPPAQKAAGRLGVAPEALLAQAALETGWGKSLPRHPDGRSSHNVFGIKAGPSWRGERVAVPTLEHEDGVAVRKRAEFRSYASLEEGFDDYVRLLTNEPRYRQALEKSGDSAVFMQVLQRAGYATDPSYAEKIGAVLNSEALGTAVAALKISHNGPLT
jgi:flagellar protein FlgJ